VLQSVMAGVFGAVGWKCWCFEADYRQRGTMAGAILEVTVSTSRMPITTINMYGLRCVKIDPYQKHHFIAICMASHIFA
jgi:hypothetical protein